MSEFDQYVLQRIYAVAYGVATRSYDAQEAGELASCVYSHVFAASAIDYCSPIQLERRYYRAV